MRKFRVTCSEIFHQIMTDRDESVDSDNDGTTPIEMKLDDSAVIIISETANTPMQQNPEPQPASPQTMEDGVKDGSRECTCSKWKWRKKPEPAIDTAFTQMSKKQMQCSTPLDVFF